MSSQHTLALWVYLNSWVSAELACLQCPDRSESYDYALPHVTENLSPQLPTSSLFCSLIPHQLWLWYWLWCCCQGQEPWKGSTSILLIRGRFSSSQAKLVSFSNIIKNYSKRINWSSWSINIFRITNFHLIWKSFTITEIVNFLGEGQGHHCLWETKESLPKKNKKKQIQL